ncbi:hypothetical protein E0493_12310 [Roseomonas sp. M0104]|uniref:Uncharacterized protein n=1 Tax=Teichococcus coralli TaxID=2545983 RepID=A0A845BFL2_9PROT|nr:hypothetical protein [Pseudoroseomonas coralli]MXP64127.1 hypothetical protein [Pseudoroseomonas coralli]
MCELPDASSLTEQDIAEITAGARGLPGEWSVFPHVNFSGEVILMLNPLAWEEEDKAIMVRRDPAGIRVLLSNGDQVLLRATVPDGTAAVEAAWRATGWEAEVGHSRVA